MTTDHMSAAYSQTPITSISTTRTEFLAGKARDSATVAVLVDISLRNTQLNGRHVDGLTLGRILKADEHASSVPVILATAHAMAGDRERFLRESGADAFIRKPIADPAELLSLVADLVSRRQV